MSVIFVAVPIALFISLIAVVAFVYQVRSGQFDDLETPPRRILFDDVEGRVIAPRKPVAGVSEAVECPLADESFVDQPF